MRTFGVEEELLLVDQQTGVPTAVARQILRDHRAAAATECTAELQQEMLEMVTRPCASLDELRAAISGGRSAADDAAKAVGARAVALATSPLSTTLHATPKQRYQAIIERYGILAHDALTCGFHVHVSIESPEEGVAVIDRIRPWLPVLLALSANSPFCSEDDTGYQSYRHLSWSQWPSAGPTELFGTLGAYRALEDELMTTGVLLDDAMLFFDARLARAHPTVEIRVADVCLSQDAATTIAGLARALVETAARQWRHGTPPSPVSASALRLASWKAALSGLQGELVHPATGAPAPAKEAVTALLEHVRAVLVDHGDAEAVERGLAAVLQGGTGAAWQRDAYRRTGSLREVVLEAIDLSHVP